LVAGWLGAERGAAAPEQGEASYRLPEVREATPSTGSPDRPVRWRAHIDPPSDGNFEIGMVATGSGVAAFASDGRICGFAEDSGKRLWCAKAGAHPAYSSGVLAFGARDGRLHAVEMRTGSALWSFAFRSSRQRMQLPGPHSPAEHVPFPVVGGFLLARTDGDAAEPNYGEISSGGSLRWSAGLDGALSAPVFLPPYVFQVISNSGGGFVATTYTFGLGPGGGLKSSVQHAIDALSVRDRTMVLRGDQASEADSPFLALDVLVADVASGAVGQRYRYEPDYEENYRLVRAGTLQGSPGKAAIDGNALYFQVASKVYRYKLGPADGQRPLLVSSDGQLVGGPYLGWTFVARGDGVWALQPTNSTIRARHVAPSTAAFRALAVDGRMVFAAFADGAVRGADLDSGRTIFSARSCDPSRLAVKPKSVYVVCAGPQWSIVSFPR
jgi:outer membrane protein assembly factor BamB